MSLSLMFKIEYKCAYIYFKNGTTEVSISYMLQKQINIYTYMKTWLKKNEFVKAKILINIRKLYEKV